ncbi:MAG: 2-hydroxyacid dehydrogenase [Paracoccaceae bacterium]
MARPRLIVTRKLPEPVEARLRGHFAVAFNPADEPFSRERLMAAMQAADGLLPTVTDILDAPVLEAGGRAKVQIVANFGVGVNNIDLRAAEMCGITVTNTPNVLTDATADIAMALILNVTRRTWEFENMLRSGNWKGFGPLSFLGTGIQGKTLGIVGMGRIGRAVAQRAYFGFGMRIIYYNRSPVQDTGIPGAVAMSSLDEVLEESDVVSLHTPGGDMNKHMISHEQLSLMKPTAYLINTARGDLVDERALVNGLVDRTIAGAGLDVYEYEPRVSAVLRRLNNVSLLPHLGSATIETRTAMGMKAVDNLIAFFDGHTLPDKVV